MPTGGNNLGQFIGTFRGQLRSDSFLGYFLSQFVALDTVVLELGIWLLVFACIANNVSIE
jgi:hypothetical protein